MFLTARLPLSTEQVNVRLEAAGKPLMDLGVSRKDLPAAPKPRTMIDYARRGR